MRITAAYIDAVARTTRFNALNLEKAMRLKELLRELHQHPFLRDRIVLKGGSALNLFLLTLDRLSVDIDLNYVGQVDKDAMREERPRVEQAVLQVCRGLGYTVQQGTNAHALFQVYLRYVNHAGRPDNVEVEINFLMRVCATTPLQKTAHQLADEEQCVFSVLSLEELMAGKLKALVQRRHPRDLYDACRLVRQDARYDPDLLRKLSVLFGATLDRDFREYTTDRVRGIDQAATERLLYPLLRADDRPTAQEMLQTAAPLLEAVLDTEKEKGFLDAIAEGAYRPDLLFPDRPETAAQVSRHPALLWKTANVREYLKSKGEAVI